MKRFGQLWDARGYDFFVGCIAMTKRALIWDLSRSDSYAMTHTLIGELSRQTEFTDMEVVSLVTAACWNRQVRDVLGDEDVSEFYRALRRNMRT